MFDKFWYSRKDSLWKTQVFDTFCQLHPNFNLKGKVDFQEGDTTVTIKRQKSKRLCYKVITIKKKSILVTSSCLHNRKEVIVIENQ